MGTRTKDRLTGQLVRHMLTVMEQWPQLPWTSPRVANAWRLGKKEAARLQAMIGNESKQDND